MPLSKHHIDIQSQPVSFNVAALGADLEREVSAVDFTLLLGSAKNGVVTPHSDLDLALYLNSSQACLDYKQFAKWAKLIGDTRNAYPDYTASPTYVKESSLPSGVGTTDLRTVLP